MSRDSVHFLFLNLGHFYDHFFLLIFATVAALTLAGEWGMGYAEMIPYATPGFVAFAVCSLPAGWIADKWSREGMMAIFFVGIGASAIVSALADGPVQLAAGLTAIGVFAAIYHPVGLAMVVHGRDKTGVPLAINGVFGNLGVACAALLTGFLIDANGWRAAFALPGAVALLTGIAYVGFVAASRRSAARELRHGGAPRPQPAAAAPVFERRLLARLFAVIFFSTAVGGLIFQSTTFALPKIFDERLSDLATTATLVGWYTFLVFAIAACAQLVVGYLVDRYAIRTVFAVVAGLQVLCFAVMYRLTGPAALVVATAFMLAVFGQIPINDVLVGRATRSEWRSRVYALRYIVTFSVSASAVPMIAWIYAQWGFAALFVVLAFAASAIFAGVLLLPRLGPAAAPVDARARAASR